MLGYSPLQNQLVFEFKQIIKLKQYIRIIYQEPNEHKINFIIQVFKQLFLLNT